MLSDALQWLRDLADDASAPVREEIDGTIYVSRRGGELEAMGQVQAPDRCHAFGDLEGLATYVQRHAKPQESIVLVGPSGIRALLDESSAVRRDELTLPLFREDLPSPEPMDYAELLEFLDRHEGNIAQGDELRQALAVVKVSESEGLTLTDRGAHVEMATNAKRGIEGATAAIPKWVDIVVRFGDPRHRDSLRFRLTVSARGGAPSFRLQHFEQDGALDRWIEVASSFLQSKLGPDWLVARAAK
jgi:hypothetical protein